MSKEELRAKLEREMAAFAQSREITRYAAVPEPTKKHVNKKVPNLVEESYRDFLAEAELQKAIASGKKVPPKPRDWIKTTYSLI